MDRKGVTISSLTRYGPRDETRAIIEPLVDSLVDRIGAHRLVALAVVGSAARGEDTWREGRLVGDVDLAAVVRWPDPVTRHRVASAARDLPGMVGLGAFPTYSLRRYRTLEFYEAKVTAWILWGDHEVFQRVRIDGPVEIPRWEGIRLVLNRAMECISARAGEQPWWYAAVKLYLALAEADLVFRGTYEPSYAARWRRVAEQGDVLGLDGLLPRVEWATAVKLRGETPAIGPDEEHERWLFRGLAVLMSRYLGRSVSVREGLDEIARQHTHYTHRGMEALLAKRRGDPWTAALRIDPAFPIWDRALRVLDDARAAEEAPLEELLAEWRRTLQPLPT